jgi:hypothetical protein
MLTTRSLHRSGSNPRKDLTEQAVALSRKADWREPSGHSDLLASNYRLRRSLSGRPVAIADRDLSTPRN